MKRSTWTAIMGGIGIFGVIGLIYGNINLNTKPVNIPNATLEQQQTENARAARDKKWMSMFWIAALASAVFFVVRSLRKQNIVTV